MYPHKWLLAALFVLQTTLAYAGCSVGALPFNLQNNTLADATQVMGDFNQIVNGANANCAASGANNDITSLSALSTPISPAQGGTAVFTASGDTGSANARTVTVTSNFSLVGGYHVATISNFTNTGPATLQVNGGTVVPIWRKTQFGTSSTQGGELIGGHPYEVIWNSSLNQWLLLGETVIVGEMKTYGVPGGSVPPGWLVADGSSFVCTTFSSLCSAIGTQYGGTASNPLLPDTRARVLTGLDNYFTSTGAANRLTSGATGCGTAFTFLGVECGNANQNHVQIQAELAGHGHTLTDPGHVHGITDPGHSHAPPVSAAFATNNNGNQASGAARAGDVTSSNTQSATTGVSVQLAGTGITLGNTGSSQPMPIVPHNMGVLMIIRF